MSLPDALFLCALSVLIVGLVAFTVYVFVSSLQRAGHTAGSTRGVGGLLHALELAPGSAAAGGRLAFFLHRLSGIGVLAFLALHVVDVSLFAFSAHLYDRVHTLYGTPGIRVLECGLMFAVLFHALNGLRILAVDMFQLSAKVSRRLLIPIGIVTVAGGCAASVVILLPVL